MKPYTPYMGSKSSVAEFLTSRMPKEALKVYIEPFFGGGSVFFAKEKAHINVLNDLDADVTGMHQAVAASPEAVMAAMKELPVSRLLYNQIREERGAPPWFALSASQRAARMIYLMSCAIDAKFDSSFPASPTRPINFNPDKDLRPHAEFFRRVTFECLPWSELLDRYVLQQKNISCLLYCDPPYVIATKSRHYGHNLDMVDHLLLARKLALVNERDGGTRTVKVMLSYDDDPDGYIRSLYRPEFGWHIETMPVQYRSGNHATATDELLITNFNTGDNS